ncbi:hypothetical protein EYV94_20480 [Puteibacter caeruleilacunae]|nr:hypothetical protein EYV94_20480 [Puteibacter caeruleilacunae]
MQTLNKFNQAIKLYFKKIEIRKYDLLVLSIIGILCITISSLDFGWLMNATRSSKTIAFSSIILICLIIILPKLIYSSYKKRPVELNKMDFALIVWTIYITLNWLIHSDNISLRIIDFFGLVILYIILRTFRKRYIPFLLSALVIGALVQTLYGNLQLWGFFSSNNQTFRLTGSFTNPGPYAGYLATTFPVILGYLLFRTNTLRLLLSKSKDLDKNTPKSSTIEKTLLNTSILIFSVFFIGLMIIVSRSRAAILASIISSGYLLFVLTPLNETYRKKLSKPRKIQISIVLMVSLGIGIFGLSQIRKASANGRLLIWKVTSDLIVDNLFTGVGTDQYSAHYMDYQARYFSENPNSKESMIAGDVAYAFNEILQLTAEQGIIGLIILMMILALIIKTPLLPSHSISNSKSLGPDLFVVIAKGGLLSLFVFSLFSYPLQILPIKITMVIYLVILAMNTKSSIRITIPTLTPNKKHPLIENILKGATLLLISAGVFFGLRSISSLHQAYSQWKDAKDFHKIGSLQKTLAFYKQAYPVFQNNGEFMTEYCRAIFMNGDTNQALTIATKAKKLYPNRVAYLVLGDCFKALNDPNQSENSYQHACNINPSKFFPQYLLAKLYNETGQFQKAIITAQQLLKKSVKVQSPTIVKIKKEMEECIAINQYRTLKTETPKHQLNNALKLAGINKTELQSALEHYESDQIDSIKLKATRFLIANMPLHYSFDTTKLSEYRTLLITLDSLRTKSIKDDKIHPYTLTHESWQKFKQSHSLEKDIYSRIKFDIHEINAKEITTHTEMAFSAWHSNPFHDSISYSEFERHILPYRKHEGLALENWRRFLQQKHPDFWQKNNYKTLTEAIDSLMNLYNDYNLAWSFMPDYPYLKVADYYLSKKSRCPKRTWFNAMLFSSLGIPVGIDYVPAWGNRDHSHAWNVLLSNSQTRPFEAFGGKQKWYINQIYNNKYIDPGWGKFRLPKVYRISYKNETQGPLFNPKVNRENIPAICMNTDKQDVTNEYFETSDITISLKQKVPLDTYYAYICVYGNDRWKPVSSAEIINNKVTFKNMGRDIIYLPAYYKKGRIIPASSAFLLTSDGNTKTLIPQKDKTDALLTRKFYAKPHLAIHCSNLIDGSFEVSSNANFKNSKQIFKIHKQPKEYPNIYPLAKSHQSRYARFVLPSKEDNIAELSFYTSINDSLVKLEGTPISYSNDAIEAFKLAFDSNALSYIQLNKLNKEDKDRDIQWVGLDFGKEVMIDAVGVCPHNDKNHVYINLEYELYYWNNKWISLGKKNAKSYNLQYDNVPKNSLLLLKCLSEGKESRIFTYNNHQQIWW